MLDVPSITFLSNYLQSYPSTILVVSHDRAFLNEVATDIVHQHSERLDYYKGANFGKYCQEEHPRRPLGPLQYKQTLLMSCRLFLRNQRREEEEREA